MIRRDFLKAGGATALALGLNAFSPMIFKRRILAGQANPDKKLIFIFQRGGNDGVNTVIPYGDPEYNDTNRPTHAIWQVNGEGEKARWTRVGAAWMHNDKKGANLKFDCFPLGGRIVVREITEQDEAGEQTNAAVNGGAQ